MNKFFKQLLIVLFLTGVLVLPYFVFAKTSFLKIEKQEIVVND